MRETLPIDDRIEEILAALDAAPAVVLTAPPGSGKTTRVPPALSEHVDGEVIVLEPRRVAARMAARRVAEERGEPLGEHVGYQVRFERVGGRATRLWFVTEGLLARRMIADPGLSGVSVVVFDEFHERSLHADLALGLVREVQEALRPDLRIVLMSATLDAEPLAAALSARIVRAEGRAHPVSIIHAARRQSPVDEPIARRVADAARRLLDQEGRLGADVLAFVPGAGEIARTAAELALDAARGGFDVLPLHGELSLEQQVRAVRKGERPRIVLATNVAETSLTLDGVSTVIDSGLARVMRFDPRTGVEQLKLERINRASAAQRAGRAGRQGPGTCVRLYTEGELAEAPEHLEPEVSRVDLSAAVLALRSFGVADVSRFAWITPPPAGSLEAADLLLRRLGALDKSGSITPLGRRLQDLPVHPRVGRMLIEAERRGVVGDGATLAALAEARPLSRESGGAATGRSDLLHLLDRVRAADTRAIDERVLRSIEREAVQLERLVTGGKTVPARGEREDALLCCVLAGFPDRVARRREKGSRQAVVVGGFAIELDEKSAVRDAELFVALDAVRVGPRAGAVARARLASAIEEAWLDEVFPGSVATQDETTWNEARGRAESKRTRRFLDLALDERTAGEPDEQVASRLLAEAARHPRVVEALSKGPVEELLLRIDALRAARPELAPAEDDAALVHAAIDEACQGKSALSRLHGAEVAALLRQNLPPRAAVELDRLIPERIVLPSGRAAPVTYRRGQPPLVSARLQEFFGTRESPRIAGGKLVVALDLLAPSHRSVQITTDLANFWKTLYPRERGELARRYPRHPWPEDPLAATATARPFKRKA